MHRPRFMPQLGSVLFMLIALCFLTEITPAEVPRLIQYQGRLTDNAGLPLDTTVSISFAILDDSVGGTQLWEETHPSVVVTGGLFDVLLGSLSLLDLADFGGTVVWLGISIGGGDMLTPLTPMVSSAYAFRSEYSAEAVHSTSSDQADDANHADTADYTIHARRADTATIALNASGNGWVDGGATVRLETITDRVGIGITSPYEKLEVDGNIKVSAGNSIYYGNENNRITGSSGVPASLTLYAQSDMWLRPSADLGIRRGSGAIFAQFDLGQRMLGLGTTSPEEMLHVENDASGGRAFIKLQTSNATTFGEVGFRIETPQNRWHFRMDDYTNNNLSSGALGLRSQNLGAEVMVWNSNGNVGIGTTAPAYKLDVSGSARANGTFYATNLDISDDAVIDDTLFAGALQANLVNAKNIVDEPGLASSLDGSSGYLGSTWTIVKSRIITVPGPGYVVAMSSGYSYIDHGLSGVDNLEYGISASSTDVPTARRMWLRFGDDADAGRYWLPVTAHNVFEVTSAGANTFYFLAHRAEGDNYMWVAGVNLILIYLPTAYGTVSTVAGIDDLEPQTVSSVAAEEEPSGADMPAILSRMEALMDEVERLKSLLPEVENK